MNRLTFSLKLLVCFFTFDAIAKTALIVGFVAAEVGGNRGALAVDRYFPLALAVAIDVLLAGLIALRTRSGRFWGIIFLGALAALSIFRIVVEPGRFVELGRAGRVKELATIAMYVSFLIVLLGRKATRVLSR